MPVIDHWWQTETGWPVAANLLGLEPMPIKAGSATVPVPGFDVQVLDREGRRAVAQEQGAVVIKEPMPPGCLSGIWRDTERFHSAYMAAFPGYYLTGDGGYVDEEGYVFIMGRTDDVINVAGHRLSTGEMEEVVGAHPAVAECAVIGIQDALKGQVPVGLVILKDGFTGDEASLEAELIERVRQWIGPIACFRQVLVVDRLPKTRSGKILRKLLRNIADGQAYGVPSTIDDPASLSRSTTPCGNTMSVPRGRLAWNERHWARHLAGCRQVRIMRASRRCPGLPITMRVPSPLPPKRLS